MDKKFSYIKARQRFSIRKLSIGAVSVLLGTAFYIGTDNTIAHADTVSPQQEGQTANVGTTIATSNKNEKINTSETTPAKNNKVEDVKENTKSNNTSNITQSNSFKNTNSDTNAKSVNTVDSATADKANTSAFSTESVSSLHKVNTNNVAQYKVSAKATLASENENQSQSQSQARTDFTVSKDTVTSNNDQITFTFNTNEAKAGDVYKIIIPETTSDGFDATDSDGKGIDSVIAGPFQGDYGDVETTYDAANKQWVITDTFTKDNSNNQPIVLTTSNKFKNDELHSTGTFNRQAFLYKNNQLLKTVDFKQNVSTYVRINWTSASKAKDALYTLNNVKVNSTSDEDYPISANTDYKWNLTIDYFDQSFNHGTVLEIPMPDNFVLNTDETNSANNSLISNYNASIVQDGKNIKVSLPQLSTQKLKEVANLTGYRPTFTIIGQFKMDVPKGNTILSTTDEPNIIQQTNSSGEVVSHDITPVSVTITGQDHGLDNIPAGDVFTGTIAPDRYEYKADGSEDKTKPVTAIEETTAHDLNKGISVRNVTPYKVNNITMTINVPDGMEISGLSTSQYDSDYKYTFTLNDGTTQSGSVVAGSTATVLQAENGKTIKSIKVVLNTLDPFESSPIFGLNGVLAKKYSDGSDVKVGNNLHTDLYVTASGLKNAETPAQFTQNQIIIAKIPVKPEIHFNEIYGNYMQIDKLPDTENAGYISAAVNDLLNKTEKLTYYVVLPTNAELLNSDDAITGLPKDATVTRFKSNGRTIVKITGNFIRKDSSDPEYPEYWEMNLNNSSIITQDNLTSDYQLYVVLPDGEVNGNGQDKVTDPEKLPFVENSNNAYSLSDGTWTVIAATGVYSASLAQGNKDFDLISNGQSDDKGSSDMTFSNVLVNSDNRNTYGTNIISHMPGTDDGKSEFNFKLKNANSVQVVNINTGDVITDGVQNYYSTEDLDLTKINRDDSELMTHFVTADKVTDWSQIKTVWTKISTIPKSTVYGVNLNGYDPTFKNDVNKTAYSSFVVWTDLLNHLGITAGGKGSASIKITGQSTIKFKLHFLDDENQPDILVPDAAHTYKDGIDTVNQTDFIKATKNSDFDDAVEKKDYSLIPKAIIDAIPDGYVLYIEKGPSIENSNTQYPNGMVNGTAEFGKVAMCDFDGDTVVYNLVKAKDFERKIVVKRNVKFVDADNTAHELKNEDNQELTPITIKGKFNPLTGTPLGIDYDTLFKNYVLTNYNDAPKTIGTFNLNSSNFKESLFTNFAFTVKQILSNIQSTNDSGKVYDIVSTQDLPKLNEAKKTDDNTIEFDQDIVFYYVPSHANLILLGQGLGQQNQLLDSSSSVNDKYNETDNISFKLSDQDLNRKGYTYKIYYFETMSLDDLVSNIKSYYYRDHNRSERISVNDITQSQLLSHLQERPDIVFEYNSLRVVLVKSFSYKKSPILLDLACKQQ